MPCGGVPGGNDCDSAPVRGSRRKTSRCIWSSRGREPSRGAAGRPSPLLVPSGTCALRDPSRHSVRGFASTLPGRRRMMAARSFRFEPRRARRRTALLQCGGDRALSCRLSHRRGIDGTGKHALALRPRTCWKFARAPLCRLRLQLRRESFLKTGRCDSWGGLIVLGHVGIAPSGFSLPTSDCVADVVDPRRALLSFFLSF